MGRPPSNGAPAFRFTQTEVAQMDAILQEHKNQLPAKEIIEGLADKFSKSTERAGKITVQEKQVWNWFQNRRYSLRNRTVRTSVKLTVTSMPRDDVTSARTAPQAPQPVPAPYGGKNASENSQMEFEAKSSRDGAWYDVQAFLSHRYLEAGDHEVLVRFAGFGSEEDEWINVRKHVRQRSLPCESTECVAVIPGDVILCFQEGKEQALYFDAHVLDAQRRRHDVRGCRCRFLVRYDHDQTEEIVPLRKVCRRPETDYRLHALHAANESASVDPKKAVDPASSTNMRVPSSLEASAAHQRGTANPRVGITAAPAYVNTPHVSGSMTPAQANVSTRSAALAPAQANVIGAPVTMAPAVTNVVAALTTVPPARTSVMTAPANVTGSPTSMPPARAHVVTPLTTVAPALASVRAAATTVTPAQRPQPNVMLASGTMAPPLANLTAPPATTVPPAQPNVTPAQASVLSAPAVSTPAPVPAPANATVTPATTTPAQTNVTAAIGTMTLAQPGAAVIPVTSSSSQASVSSTVAISTLSQAPAAAAPAAVASTKTNAAVASTKTNVSDTPATSAAPGVSAEQKKTDLGIAVPVRADITATPSTTTAEQRGGDVSPPPGFSKMPTSKPLDATVVASDDPVKE
ncbi:sawadee homeodomain homolog 2-like protein [Drosera capensis]